MLFDKVTIQSICLGVSLFGAYTAVAMEKKRIRSRSMSSIVKDTLKADIKKFSSNNDKRRYLLRQAALRGEVLDTYAAKKI